AYLTGESLSLDFPVTGGLQPSSGGGQDAFVLKLSSGGTLVYSTYLGGSGGSAGLPESGAAIAVDAAGNAYVAGTTSSGNFPVVNAVQPRLAGGITDAFVAKLNPSGGALVYCTYLGGSSVDYGTAIGLDGTGSVWIAGYTASTNLLLKAPIQAANAGAHDVFAVLLSPDGQTIVQSTYFGGLAADAAHAIATTAEGVFIAGQTASTNFPVKDAARPSFSGILDGFVLRLGLPAKHEGGVDSATCEAIMGWAWDANRPSTPVEVSLYLDGVLLLTVTADRFRPDLLAAGIGNGAHGFHIPTPDQVKDGSAHLIDVRFTATGASLDASPRTLTCGGVPQIVGSDDGANCSYVAGWAWDMNNPNRTINVDIFDDTKLIATIPADWCRTDLAAAGIGNGCHGYYYPLPYTLKDGKPHKIYVRPSGTSMNLPNTGRTVTCTGPEGIDDVANCQYFAGWAWDRSDPSTIVSVDIFAGSQLLATIPANSYRADLAAAGIGDGRHAYFFDTPAALKNGQPHKISVRIHGTNISLWNTGHTITCPGP
ncbi:MAG TPA: SBBP repeat-containing protein, partial [Verrucomicrobiota bacterium]|nr:SBBP repeat-containing protein [Verrucomicrobiota bacterium]